MSIKGDLDAHGGEEIITETDFPHGLTVGGQRIIENADKFLDKLGLFHKRQRRYTGACPQFIS